MIASAELAKVDSYIDGVLSGDIVVGKLVRAAVERHVSDLYQAEHNQEEFPYYFDGNAAECACAYYGSCLKHSIGDYQGMPFELEPWQAFGVASIMGWKRSCDNTRRFRKVYWSTARKNGKSTWAGGLALLLASMDINPKTGRPESIADVILCATKREQVQMIMFAEIVRMRQQSIEIRNSSTYLNKQITFTANGGSIRCVGSDRTYDGLNPSAIFKDELHEFKAHHEKFLNTINTAGGSRSQQLDLITTTAGDTSSYIWLNTYAYFTSVVLGDLKDEGVFCYCFQIDDDDDPFDESCWVKANPNIGKSLKIDYLRQQAKEYKTSEVGTNTFTRYHCNRVVSSTAKAFDLDQWDKCKGELSNWSEADAIGGGCDLGARDDFAAWGLVARFPMERIAPEFASDEDREEWELWDYTHPLWRYEIRSAAYLADDTKRDISVKPFSDWAYNGLIKQSRFPITDLQSDLAQLCRKYGVADVAYDPYNGQLFQEFMQSQGVPTWPMSQTCANFHEPIDDMRQAMEDGRLIHDGNPVLRWCIGNAVAIQDRNEHWMLCKRDSSEKIDMAVAVVMAYRRAMVSPPRATGAMFVT